ncbi:undecaprenyl-phosphate glucose phosphotransferase [Sphaerobacter sp.]|uniref:undecaprenyl-phosphate glucose phosphotransferase n=1 Tax=Sphaerobacter sp. TaxID=2099654 RepID=UPI0025D9F524|nr:undecaprenyl-phosphate glucose phosphotransferase [Sphaerobacter sp.]
MATLTGRDVTAELRTSTGVQQRASARREPRWLTQTLRAGTDAALVLLAFALAYALRYRLELGGDVLPGFTQPFDFFLGKALLLVVVSVIIFHLRGLYRLPRWTSFLDEAQTVVSGSTTAMAIVILYSFLQRFYPSRLIFIYAWLLMIALLLTKRLMTRVGRQLLWRRGIGVDRVLVVGAGRAGQRLLQYIYNQPQLGYRVAGLADDVPLDDDWGIATERRVERPQYLGRLADIGEIVDRHEIDEVMIALPPTEHNAVAQVIATCRERGIPFMFVPDLFEMALDRVRINEVAGLALIEVKDARISGWNYAIKRAMDVVIATTVLTLAAPLMLLIAIAIKLDSPGPILFGQERVGKNGRRFTLYKFRSMCKDAEEKKKELLAAASPKDGLLFKLKDDPRVTRVGRILRRTSLDELPQFFNVLIGEMSVVGPRPQVPSEVAAYEDWHYQRLMVTPGLTGLWQVNGRSNLTFDEMVKLDLYYAEHWSPWLDIKLILRTIPAVLLGRGAY